VRGDIVENDVVLRVVSPMNSKRGAYQTRDWMRGSCRLCHLHDEQLRSKVGLKWSLRMDRFERYRNINETRSQVREHLCGSNSVAVHNRHSSFAGVSKKVIKRLLHGRIYIS